MNVQMSREKNATLKNGLSLWLLVFSSSFFTLVAVALSTRFVCETFQTIKTSTNHNTHELCHHTNRKCLLFNRSLTLTPLPWFFLSISNQSFITRVIWFLAKSEVNFSIAYNHSLHFNTIIKIGINWLVSRLRCDIIVRNGKSFGNNWIWMSVHDAI